MAAEYDFRRRPNPKGDGELQPLYPRIVNKGTIEMERLVQDIADMSSFTPGDVKGVVALLEDRISYYLSEGHHVQLGDIGYFSASLQARPVMDPKEIHSQTIFFGKVHLRVSPDFRKRCAEKSESFANGREVRNFFDTALTRQANRLADCEEITTEMLTTLTLDDVKIR